ncbi:MAG: Na+/H+ antiporter NhaA [Bauldia sp.]|nr:Na+/H+ antiporter NhaA [Bauldia sp.]
MAHAGSEVHRLDRPVDNAVDHILGNPDAPLTLVEYGSYSCPHCRAANAHLTEVRDELGNRLKYVFRHRPVTGSELARRAADLAERAPPEKFWDTHIKLMTRSATLTEEDLKAVAADLGIDHEDAEQAAREEAAAKARVAADMQSAVSSGVRFTPTFFINGRRYDGPWDTVSFRDAIIGRLGPRVLAAAISFAGWGPSAGLLLIIAALVAVILTNTGVGEDFTSFWEREAGITIGSLEFHMSLLHWINDGLLTIFFLVVGLEIKREFTVGHLASRKSATLPIAAALGGMIVPVILYLLVNQNPAWGNGWGVPMATDTAFAVAIMVMMGSKVPIELRVFLTAAAIIDDIGAVAVVAVFYSGDMHWEWLGAAAAVTAALGFLNYGKVYRLTPYLILGVILWFCVHEGGLHATLAGIVLAAFIPTRPPPDLGALMIQANAIVTEEAKHSNEVLRQGPSDGAMRALNTIYDRLESPADRLLRVAAARSSYVVLPIFALANGGVLIATDVFAGHTGLMLAIFAGLFIGKPAGFFLLAWLAVRLKLADPPHGYNWRQLLGAGSLAGIGFTMSLFIAGQAFALESDFAAAKIAIFGASILSALAGVAILWNANKANEDEEADEPEGQPARALAE